MQRPELRPDRCGVCRICLANCPGRVFSDISADPETVRGILGTDERSRQSRTQPPCQSGCPLAEDIPGYLSCIAAGDTRGALERILQNNPFPAVLGHVCHHPCERACLSGSVQPAPAIRELKRFASMAERPPVKKHSGPPIGRVAVIGAGPAGLAASWALSREGVRVVLREASPAPGGVPSWAIPPFRLPRKAVQEDVDFILRHGIELQLNSRVEPAEIASLAASHDAVVLACGAPLSKLPDIPDCHLPGVWLGLDFLRQLALGPPPEITPPIVVIGGGNVATDAARWSLRLASPVTIIYRRERQDMTAYSEEVEASAAEGIRFLFRSQPLAIEGNRREAVRLIRIQSTSPGPPGHDGRRPFRATTGTEKTIPARTVILALGQETEAGRYSEGLPPNGRIYMAGDMATGPATVVEAVAGGIQCARKIMQEVFA